MRKLKGCWVQHLRYMVKGGWARQPTPEGVEEECYKYIYKNREIEEIVGTMHLPNFIEKQHLKYIAHICRSPNSAITKKLLFAEASKPYYHNPWIRIVNLLQLSTDQAKASTKS